MKKEATSHDLDNELGDKAYLVVDTDAIDNNKIEIFKRILGEENDVFHLILSNPCFEVWYLAHFTEAMRSFANNRQVINALKGYMPNYKKSDDVYQVLNERTDLAIQTAKRWNERHIEHGYDNLWDRNPSSCVYKIIEYVGSANQ